MDIPYQKLKPETLQSLIEEFVTRDGTDYGLHEVSLEEKVNEVLKQLTSGQCRIVFDINRDSCHIVSNRQ